MSGYLLLLLLLFVSFFLDMSAKNSGPGEIDESSTPTNNNKKKRVGGIAQLIVLRLGSLGWSPQNPLWDNTVLHRSSGWGNEIAIKLSEGNRKMWQEEFVWEWLACLTSSGHCQCKKSTSNYYSMPQSGWQGWQVDRLLRWDGSQGMAHQVGIGEFFSRTEGWEA